jgi:5-methylcytosine-specific restriction endonuclease McrA
MSSRKHASIARLKPRVATLDASIARQPTKQADSDLVGQEWRKLVAYLIRQRGRRCERCDAGANGKRVWLIGDHVVERLDGGELLDPGNIVLLCAQCHATKTQQAKIDRFRGG